MSSQVYFPRCRESLVKQAGAEPLSRARSLVRLLLFHIKLFLSLYLPAQLPKRELLHPGPGRNVPEAGMAWASHMDGFTPKFVALHGPEHDTGQRWALLGQNWLGGLQQHILSRAPSWPVGTRNLLWL